MTTLSQSSVGPAKEDQIENQKSKIKNPSCPCGQEIDNPNYPVCSECWYQTSASIRYAYVFKKNRRAATKAHLLSAASKRKRS